MAALAHGCVSQDLYLAVSMTTDTTRDNGVGGIDSDPEAVVDEDDARGGGNVQFVV
jgi:hypothetical protein